ncbi:alpha/beta fold hydrolase [Saccharopolyspora griseoalba]|uniref:Alpha/beta fold hydrolase n=1 Tax=Saccharopolyspora griseoalba TaxID=1431848 RepID=A0ABW2LKC4_9PSEU
MADGGSGGRRRRVLGITIIAGVAALVAAFALRAPAPVGHWKSAAGHAEFEAAYAAAMRELPAASEVRDVRTAFGFVRVYRSAGAGGEPLVLLPDRASASPVWADNLPSLLRVGDVYAVDLLGELGRSVQEVPITDDADQAAWLDQVLEELPQERFHVIGLSIGGWTAANLAIHRPQRVATPTLIDPVHTFDSIPAWTAFRAIPASVP